MDITVVDRPGGPSTADTRALVESHGRTCRVIEHDLADTAGRADRARADGPVDLLVDNTGIARLEHFNEITPQAWRAVTAVNVDAVFFLSQRVAEHMEERIPLAGGYGTVQ